MDQCSTILTAAHLFSVKGSGHGHVALQCFKLKRSLYACLWGETSGVLNQIPGLGQQCTQILKMNGITTFTDVLSASDEIVGKACGRGIPFANELRAKVSQLLSDALEIHASIEYENGRNSKPVGVVCKILPAKNAPNFSGKKSGSGLRYMLVRITDRRDVDSKSAFSAHCASIPFLIIACSYRSSRNLPILSRRNRQSRNIFISMSEKIWQNLRPSCGVDDWVG